SPEAADRRLHQSVLDFGCDGCGMAIPDLFLTRLLGRPVYASEVGEVAADIPFSITRFVPSICGGVGGSALEPKQSVKVVASACPDQMRHDSPETVAGIHEGSLDELREAVLKPAPRVKTAACNARGRLLFDAYPFLREGLP